MKRIRDLVIGDKFYAVEAGDLYTYKVVGDVIITHNVIVPCVKANGTQIKFILPKYAAKSANYLYPHIYKGVFTSKSDALLEQKDQLREHKSKAEAKVLQLQERLKREIERLNSIRTKLSELEN